MTYDCTDCGAMVAPPEKRDTDDPDAMRRRWKADPTLPVCPPCAEKRLSETFAGVLP